MKQELSPREQEVLNLLVTGEGFNQIAERLGIKRSTIARHTTHIYNKLGVNSRTAAVFVAVKKGLI